MSLEIRRDVGVVTNWFDSADGGFGFIEPNAGGHALRVDSAMVKVGDARPLAKGDVVQFECALGGPIPQAVNVYRIGAVLPRPPQPQLQQRKTLRSVLTPLRERIGVASQLKFAKTVLQAIAESCTKANDKALTLPREECGDWSC